MAIHQVQDKIKRERSKLKAYQSGKIKVVKTNRQHIDATLTGLLPGDIVAIAGASGAGKSFELQTIREDLMNVNINPFAEEYVFLDYSFEMKLFNIILRGLNKSLRKPKKDILLKEFSIEEAGLANRYIETLMDPRFFIEENPLTPTQFYEQSREFLLQHMDKKAVVIAIDHIALFKNEKSEKKGTVDAVVEYINLLKREFPNVIFIILTQLNRSILGRVAEKDSNSAPNRGDVYQSDTIFHIVDYLIVVQNPFRLGINEYMRVNPDHYEHLEEFMTESIGTTKKVSFKTVGNIFFHVLKVREGEVIFTDIYIEKVENVNLVLYRTEKIDVAKDDLDFDELETTDTF